MGTVLREYETLFVLNPEMADDAAENVLGRLRAVLTKMEAVLLREEPWGKRKFAFTIRKHPRGNFFKFHYVGMPGTLEEFERTLRNTEGVVRYLSTGHGNVLDVEARRAEVERKAREDEARRAKKEAERAEQLRPIEATPE